MYRYDRTVNCDFRLYDVVKREAGKVLMAEYELGEETGDYLEVTEEFFKEHFSETMTPMEREHGRCIDYRMTAYHDIYVYEDGFEDYVYIGD